LAIAPSERLTIERVRSFISHLAETNTPQSVASQVHALYLAARMMMPKRDWAWLKAIKTRLYRAAPTHTRRGPVITSVQLLELGQQLMDESKPTVGTPITADNVVRYRDGLMVALLAFVPIRRKNLAALEIGRHLVEVGDRWFVIIPREEAKTRTPIEFPVPELLNPYLAFYLDSVRPRMLQRQACSALWVGTKGGALVYGAIGQVFCRISRRLGVRITPHDIRDAAATTWAISPRSYPCRPRPACPCRSAYHYQILQSGAGDRSESGLWSRDRRYAQKANSAPQLTTVR
jgi:integrase